MPWEGSPSSEMGSQKAWQKKSVKFHVPDPVFEEKIRPGLEIVEGRSRRR